MKNEWLYRKDFQKIFEPYNRSGTQIWVVTRVKKLRIEIIKMAINLANLEFIKYVRICDNSLAAASENYPKRPKVPITMMSHETAIGIEILYSTKFKSIDFYDINSPISGKRSEMVDAVFIDFPESWTPSVFSDWSNGFWDEMAKKHNKVDWFM